MDKEAKRKELRAQLRNKLNAMRNGRTVGAADRQADALAQQLYRDGDDPTKGQKSARKRMETMRKHAMRAAPTVTRDTGPLPEVAAKPEARPVMAAPPQTK